MKFVCGECKTKYTISDEKVRGKVLKVKCKKCEAIVEVREAAAGVEAIAPVVSRDSLIPSGGVRHPEAPAPRPRVATSPPGDGAGRPRVPTAPPMDGAPRARVPTAPPAGAPRPRVPTAPPAGAPRPRVPTAPPQAQPPRGRIPTAPPPPPPEAIAARPTTPRPPTRAGKSTPLPQPPPRAAAPSAPLPAAASPSASPTASGLRPAATRPASFVGRGAGGGPASAIRASSTTGAALPGGLAGSLAEALRESVVPMPDEEPEENGTVVSPSARGILEDLGLATPQMQAEWYVAIRDQPIGPITKDEVQARIQAGDVQGSSLIWREGMDDWRPLRDVHALGDILRGTGRAPVPETPAGRTPLRGSSMTPLPIADRSVGSVATPIPKGAVAVPSALFPESRPGGTKDGSGSLEIPIEDLRHPGSQAAGLPPPPAAVLRSPDVDQYASVLPPAPAKKMSPFAWVGMIGAIAFGITLALGLLYYLGPRLNAPRVDTERVRVVTIPGEAPPPELPGVMPGLVPGIPAPGSAVAPGADRRPGIPHPGVPGAAGKAPMPGKGLSAADAELLARMGQQGLPADRVINSDALRKAGGSGGSGGSALTADQVRGVVRRESRTVQQCYERAMRGAQQATDMRVTVTANVGPSGSVTGVRARGGSNPGMLACIEGAVRRWRFPGSTGPSQPEIPFVFTAADR